MISIQLRIRPASSAAMKLYLCGNAVFPERFSYASKRDQVRIVRAIRGFDDKIFRHIFDRNDLDQLKRDVLLGRRSARSVGLRRELARVSAPSIRTERARALAGELAILWRLRRREVSRYLEHVATRTKKLPYAAITMPGVGESSNIVKDVLVIGSDASPNVAFGILLEELLHGVLVLPPKKQFGMGAVSDWLYSEAYTGAHLYQLLRSLKYPARLTHSLVFTWHGGKRTKLVKKILRSLSRS